MTNPDLIITLGMALMPDGTLDWIGSARVEKAVEVAKQFPNAKLLFSGGHSPTSETETRSQAEAMKEYALSLEPDLEDRIIIENKGNSTIHQFHKIKAEFLLPNDFKKVALVTDEIHMPRAYSALEHMLGDDFTVEQYPAKLQLAGKWRAYIEDGEKEAMRLLKETRLDPIDRGDHEEWLRREREFRKQYMEHFKKTGERTKIDFRKTK